MVIFSHQGASEGHNLRQKSQKCLPQEVLVSGHDSPSWALESDWLNSASLLQFLCGRVVTAALSSVTWNEKSVSWCY